MSPAAYLTPALSALRAEVDARWPNRDKSADGWIGDAAHASRHSDHNPEADGSVDAIDITHDPVNGPDCNELSEMVKDDPRIEGGGYVIWDWQIYDPDTGQWVAYNGTNGHTHHMHVSVADRLQNDTSLWLKEVDDVTPEDMKAFRDIVQNNTEKVREIIQSNTEEVVTKFTALLEESSARTRRVIWKSFGKTKAEIDELEAALVKENQ